MTAWLVGSDTTSKLIYRIAAVYTTSGKWGKERKRGRVADLDGATLSHLILIRSPSVKTEKMG